MPAEPDADTRSDKPPRLASLDAYRGLTMILLAFTVPNWGWQEPIAERHEWLRPLADQFEHVDWRGLTLWDLIQPSFMFMVGVSLPYSIASRRRRDATTGDLWRHAATRALLLVLLGVFLRSLGRDETNWTFEDVVTQIGLGYLPLFGLAFASCAGRAAAIALLLAATWLLYAVWPVPGEGFDAAANSAGFYFDGYWAHWNLNTGPGHYLDQWLLNRFPRTEPFLANSGGYTTLNFAPSIATMALGLCAGARLHRGGEPVRVLQWLIGWGVAIGLLGVFLDATGLCPLVKKLWTPSFVLASGGLCLLILATLYAVVDVAGIRRWSWPARVVGRNPLAMYVMTWTLAAWVFENLRTHLGGEAFTLFGDAYAPLIGNLLTGTALWLVCWWMDRNRVYLRL